MRRRSMRGVVTVVALVVWLIAAASAFAGSPPIAGARPAAASDADRSIQSQSAQSIPTFFQEVTAAFTASPTTGGLGDALAASRVTFLITEAIEFNALLRESGLAATFANLQLFVFDQTGGRLVASFFLNGVFAPTDLTDFFIQLNAGSLPRGQHKWLMAITDIFGNAFVTPLQALNVQ